MRRPAVHRCTAVAAAATRCTLAESPVWDPRTNVLHWVDIPGGVIWSAVAHTAGGLDTPTAIVLDPPVTCIVPAIGGWIVCHGDSVEYWDAAFASTYRQHHVVPHPHAGMRLNDGKADPAGRLVVGSISSPGLSTSGQLLEVSPDGLTVLATGLGMSNGLDWTPRGDTLYLADSRQHHVLAFSDMPHSAVRLTHRRVWLAVDDGLPDGLTVDAAGNIWLAVWGAGQVRGYTPDGYLRAVIELPAPNASSCVFGGPGLTDLYISVAGDDHPAIYVVPDLGRGLAPRVVC